MSGTSLPALICQYLSSLSFNQFNLPTRDNAFPEGRQMNLISTIPELRGELQRGIQKHVETTLVESYNLKSLCYY